jgi:hypothetical protein
MPIVTVTRAGFLKLCGLAFAGAGMDVGTLEGLAISAPVAVESNSVKVSGGSFALSGMSGMVTFCTVADAVPAANVSVPLVRVRSAP